MSDKVAEFLEGLADLSQRTGLVVGGCGCLGSPYLEHTGEGRPEVYGRLSATGRYVAQPSDHALYAALDLSYVDNAPGGRG